MSGIAAILDLDGGPAEASELSGMLKELERVGPDGTASRSVGPAALGCARFDTLPEDGPQPITVDGVTVVVDARLDNRDELERELNVPRTASEATFIAAAIGKWDENAPEHLEGDFAVIAWLAKERRLLACRDRFGVRPLFIAETGKKLLLASTIDALLTKPNVSTTFDPEYFISYFATCRAVSSLTPYRCVRRIARSSLLTCSPEHGMKVRSYYELKLERTSHSPRDAAEITFHLLKGAVEKRARAKNVACEVSGGMDSTSIFALSRRIRPDIEARSLISDRLSGFDERRYSQTLVGRSVWRQTLIDEAMSPLTSEPSLLFNEPVQELLLGESRARLYDPVGHVQLSGHGGDALMTARYGEVNELLRAGRVGAAWRCAKSWGDSRDRPVSFVIWYALRSSAIPKNSIPWASRTAMEQAKAVVAKTRDNEHQQALGVEYNLFNLYNETGLLAPILPVEMSYPFLDRQLVEFALALPPALKTRGPVDKVLLREAVKEYLPKEILERSTKSGAEAAYSLSAHCNQVIIEGWLEEPLLTQLGVVTKAGLQRLSANLSRGSAKGLTTAMIALSAEAWLQARTDSNTSGLTVSSRLAP